MTAPGIYPEDIRDWSEVLQHPETKCSSGSGKYLILYRCHSWSKFDILDTSPILVYPVLITAGKVTDFAELPTFSHLWEASMKSHSCTSVWRGEWGRGCGGHLLLPGQAPDRVPGEVAVSIAGSLAPRSSAIPVPGERNAATQKSLQTAALCLTSRGQTELSRREQDFKMPSACPCNW